MKGAEKAPYQDKSKTSEHQSDWLNTEPIFYSKKSGACSRNINEVIDFQNFEINWEGLSEYLDFGYCVFGLTPFKDIHFLMPNEKLTISSETQKISTKVVSLGSSFEVPEERPESEKLAIESLEASINNWEKESSSNLILPMSGGLDSRMLASMLEDKSRIQAFTYGISKKQSESYEVVLAKEIAQQLKVSWKQIELGNFHQYLEDWLSLYGPSTHAHGMYHIEFYKKILELTSSPRLLSGIVGDALAGSLPYHKVERPEDLIKIGRPHGVRVGTEHLCKKVPLLKREEFFEQNRINLLDYNFQVITLIRFKMILLSYLIRLPKHLGIEAWSPFLQKDVALKMLSIPRERRKNRIWQKDYLKRKNLYPEGTSRSFNFQNTLDLESVKKFTPAPLNKKLLSEIVDPNFVEQVNRNYATSSLFFSGLSSLPNIPKLEAGLGRLRSLNPQLSAYNTYMVLKPLEWVLSKRGDPK